MRRRTWIATTFAAGALALAGCGSTGGSTGAAGSTGSATGNAGAAAPAGASAAALKTWSSPLGDIVVTSNGTAVYVFDKDHPGAGTSACTGACAHLWPAVTTASGTPQVSGVTGTVGTVAGDGGTQQLTLDGRRLYTYAGDGGPGQVSGEGVMGIWWVVSPSGQAIQKSAAATSSDSGGYSY